MKGMPAPFTSKLALIHFNEKKLLTLFAFAYYYPNKMISPCKGEKNMRTNLIVISILMCLLIGCNNAQKPSESKVVKYRIVDSFEENKGRYYDVIFEDDEVTIKEVETTLRRIADEKIQSEKPDALTLNARLESEDKKGNGGSIAWARLIWDPDGKSVETNDNTLENYNQFTFKDGPDWYEYQSICSAYSYDQLARTPDVYIGFHIKITGIVVQVKELGNNEVKLRVNISKDKHPDYTWTDTVLVTYTRPAGEARILERDIINVWGVS